MNRLLKKIREFGLIISLENVESNSIIPLSRLLKKAHLPLVLIPYKSSEEKDMVKAANESENLFIGSDCSSSPAAIGKSFASGAHFAVCSVFEDEELLQLNGKGLDFFMRISSQDELFRAVKYGARAVIINSDTPDYLNLIQAVTERQIPFFLEGILDEGKLRQWQLIPFFIAWISPLPRPEMIEDIENQAFSLIQKLLGIRFRSLSLTADSEKLKEAAVLASLSAIPLINNAKRDCLEIEIYDMDRTISHLKWRNIYMDPLTAEMKGESILSTELYEEFLGWPVRLTAAKRLFPAG
ncbi:hypothetical protein [Spirochaeta isovalerica]|uniref:2-keto-3-deoxy-6-phosphogluconate aldolase n=1 Tax=Spirochaeta isovalerica TaxID=150 RepID=A0A841RAH6_9SPIO|nr:hypothetical protein [Spirochaeta isovalerica]MBB6480247.1 2-keto-3-deoxy-6-phosphogluconate aldolase [Spirochaeta isovalerica]